MVLFCIPGWFDDYILYIHALEGRMQRYIKIFWAVILQDAKEYLDFWSKGQMDTAQRTFQLATLPFATLHDVVQSYPFTLKRPWVFGKKKAQPLCFRIYRPQALHWQEQCFTLATSMAEFSTAAVDPFDSDNLRLEALKRAWKGAKTRLANWQLGKFQTFIAERVYKKTIDLHEFCCGFSGIPSSGSDICGNVGI